MSGSPPMPSISNRLQALQSSATLQISQRANELRAAGRDVIGLGAGEPDFDSPEPALSAGIQAIEGGQTHYTAVAGTDTLREAIALKLRRDNELEFTPQQILVSCGAKQCLFNAIVALTDPGDVVAYPAPYWVSYPSMAQLAQARAAVLPTTSSDGFKLSPAVLEQALEKGVKVLLLNSPSNPCGSVYAREELQALGEVLSRYPETWVVTDEIYEKLVFAGAEHWSIATVVPEIRDRTIVINGVSKAYAMTGWRIGYSAGPREAIAAMARFQGHTTSNASSISQAAAAAALTSGDEAVRTMHAAFAKRRDLLLQGLRKIPGVRLRDPQGAFYMFPDVSAWYSTERTGSAAVCTEILETVGVALVPGIAFGNDDCLRISYAASEETLERALDRLAVYARETVKVRSTEAS